MANEIRKITTRRQRKIDQDFELPRVSKNFTSKQSNARNLRLKNQTIEIIKTN